MRPRSISSSGVGNCLFLRARGWGIDLQERKKLQIPEGVPGERGLQVKLNHAWFNLHSVDVLKANQEPESRADVGVGPEGVPPPFVREFCFFCKRVSDGTSSFVT